jgi:putative ABC transport system ATP-binding protein
VYKLPLLELKGVSQYKQGQEILNDITFAIQEGDIIGCLGPSGAGKTSLFRLLNMLDSPSKGEIFLRGKKLDTYDPMLLRRQIGYLAQKPRLFGIDVKDNLSYPYEIIGQNLNEAEIQFYLNKVGFDNNILTKAIKGLSGGEQQRIGLIRLLLVKPKILLLDEFTSALDEETTRRAEDLILSERTKNKLAVLFITHNIVQAKRLANKVIHIENGSISFYDEAEQYFSTHHERISNNE